MSTVPKSALAERPGAHVQALKLRQRSVQPAHQRFVVAANERDLRRSYGLGRGGDWTVVSRNWPPGPNLVISR
jgi:hypothetical protein